MFFPCYNSDSLGRIPPANGSNQTGATCLNTTHRRIQSKVEPRPESLESLF
jgi:hypothetical protein